MTKNLFIDCDFNFGKYKGDSIASVAEHDPGYIYWCSCAGVATLDEILADKIADWVVKNPGDAAKVKRSAEAVRKEKAVQRGHSTPRADSAMYVKEASPTPTSESWGTW